MPAGDESAAVVKHLQEFWLLNTDSLSLGDEDYIKVYMLFGVTAIDDTARFWLICVRSRCFNVLHKPVNRTLLSVEGCVVHTRQRVQNNLSPLMLVFLKIENSSRCPSARSFSVLFSTAARQMISLLSRILNAASASAALTSTFNVEQLKCRTPTLRRWRNLISAVTARTKQTTKV